MKKKALLVVALLLAISITMAAMAYNSAYVWNAQKINIVNTNSALVALIPKPTTDVGNKDGTVSLTDNGSLQFYFGKGGVDGTGIQPGGDYTWNDLFTIKNNSLETVRIRIAVDSKLGEVLTLFKGSTVYYKNGEVGSHDFVLAPGAQVSLDANIHLHPAAPVTGLNGNAVLIYANAQ